MSSRERPPSGAVSRTIEQLVRDEWPRLVATLVSEVGDLTLAEDVAQDAAEVALKRWLDDGIPDRPGAWITTVARRRAVDRIRRERVGREKSRTLARLEERLDHDGPPPAGTVLQDEQLGLIFGCCHPALTVEAQVALTLRSVAGLTTAEIAAGFLVPESTMAQRLVRAKRKIAKAAIPFRVPGDAELLSRIGIVHHVLYLVFNEGYVARSGQQLGRPDLAGEAIRLTELLTELLRDDAETHGLLALFLFIESRRAARTGPDGELVLLPDQDRSKWDRSMIEQGRQAIDRAMALGRPGSYQIEAAINALHAEAGSSDDTDWAQIELLYRGLVHRKPTVTVALNHAVALAMVEGPERGLEALSEPVLAERLDQYSYYHSARADMFRRAMADATDPTTSARLRAEAETAYRRAAELAVNERERSFLARRLAELDDSGVNRPDRW